ncbi:MAG: hypothetical protein ACRYFS_00325 [Janthinobacterium lividum]
MLVCKLWKKIDFPIAILFFTLIFLTVRTAPPALAADLSSPTLTFQADPDLQKKVTIDAVDCPVGDVLSKLSLKLKTDLIASSEVADQRITLKLANQPVLDIMTRLTWLLSHSPNRAEGYYWGRMDRQPGSRHGILFWRDGHSLAEEQEARDAPRLKMALLLRDVRDLCRMTPEQRTQYHGELSENYLNCSPDDEDKPFEDALATMSNSDLDDLMSGQHVMLDPTQFTSRISLYQQAQAAKAANARAAAQAVGQSDPFPDGIPALTPPALYVKVDDNDGRYPDQSDQFGVFLEGMDTTPTNINVQPGQTATTHITIDPMQPNFLLPPEPLNVPSGGPIYDLMPILKNKAITDRQRHDLGFNLQALAQVANITLYQEAFLKPSASELAVTKGTLAQILASIRETWDCHITKTGTDYLVWNRRWVQDRASDVPQRLIKVWQTRLKGQTAGTPLRSEIAATLTWAQVRLTLSPALPETGPWDSLIEYRGLRLLGNLTPQEYSTASSPLGLALVDMQPWQQQALAQDFAEALAKVQSDQVAQAVLTISEEPGDCLADGSGWDRTTISLLYNQWKLWSTIVTSPLPLVQSPAAPSSTQSVTTVK